MDKETEKFVSSNTPVSMLKKLEKGKRALSGGTATVEWTVNEERHFWGIKSAGVDVERIILQYDVQDAEGYVEHKIEEISAGISVIGDNIFPLYPEKVIVRSAGNISDATVDFGGKKSKKGR